MKKLIAIVFLSAIAVVLLIVLAFYYIDFSGHKRFDYEVLVGGKHYGSWRVDKYVTEDKVIYKAAATCPNSLGYPTTSEKLFLKKRTMTPLKYVEEAKGVKGGTRLILLQQEGERTDYLFLEHPRFLSLKGFETGSKTMVFSPYDVMLFMPIMQKYNYWKKGSQFSEVMIPVGEPVPPMRDKIEVRFLRDEYVPIMGKRVEAERFLVRAKGIPDVKLALAKYSHRILTMEVRKIDMSFVLTGFAEAPGKRIQPVLSRLVSFFLPAGAGKMDIPGMEDAESFLDSDAPGVPETEKKEIFFDSNNMILSGRLWIPEGKAPFPAVLVVPKDGPMTRGEEMLLQTLGEFLSSSGFVVMGFDDPGLGRSQGNVSNVDDAERVRNIRSAVGYLEAYPAVRKDSITIIGHKEGGYLALEAAKDLPDLSACVILGVPAGSLAAKSLHKGAAESIQEILRERELGPFDEGFMRYVTSEVEGHIEEVSGGEGDFKFFLGVRTPLEEYRQVLARRPYEAMMSFGKPLLLILGKNDIFYSQEAVDGLRSLKGRDTNIKIAVFRNLSPYMGTMVGSDGSWDFKPDGGILDLIRGWIEENTPGNPVK